MPAEPERITDPELARQFAIGQSALRRSMIMSIVLDVLIAIVLIVAGLPVLVVVLLAALIIGTSTFALSRILKSGEKRLEDFRDPVTGRIELPRA
jgi:cell division protein FtsW (lipid II flippase)